MSKKINLKNKKNEKRIINREKREKREYQLFKKQKYSATADYAIEMLLK